MEYGWSHGKEGGPGPRGFMHERGERGPGAHANPAALVEAHLAYLKTDLGITVAQQPAWNAFAATARKQAGARQALREKMREEKATLSVAQRMEKFAEAMKQRAAGMQDMAGAVKDLYAALTPEQKAIADRDFAAHRFAGHRRGLAAWSAERR
jgi:LTXXQ motif family protein